MYSNRGHIVVSLRSFGTVKLNYVKSNKRGDKKVTVIADHDGTCVHYTFDILKGLKY